MELPGDGWLKKVGDIYVNRIKQLIFKCKIIDCDATCDSLNEFLSHIELKHCNTTNQMGARVQNRRDSLLPPHEPRIRTAQCHGKDPYEPIRPIPSTSSTNAVNQNDAHNNNGSLVGASTPAAQFHGKVPYEPVRPLPSTPCTSPLNQIDAHNNGNLVGATTPAAAPVHTVAANLPVPFFIPKMYTQKVEVNKTEHHLRFAYNCTACRKAFGNRNELDRHKQRCSDKKYRCSVCKHQFATVQGKLSHERKVHADKFKYPCSECDRAFERYAEFGVHERRHTNPSIKCDFCSKMVCTKFGKELHIKHRHSNRRYHCQFCTGYSSLSGDTMRKHYKDKHGGIPKGGI